MPASTVTPSSDRLSQLDGLRGVAILFVMWHHFGLHLPGWLDWGPVAPNIFFLLSGYLITRSLFKMHDRPTNGQIFHYHARRLTRLLPALYVMLGVGFLIGLSEFREGFVWHALFASNFQMIANDDWSGYASHLWSLSVQEQFYLFWPLLLFLPVRFLPATMVFIFLGAALFRAWCLQAGTTEMFRWLMLPSSLDAFAAGGLIAWLIKWKKGPLLTGNWRWPALLLALACWFYARNLRGLYGTNAPELAFIDTFETTFFAWMLIELLEFPKSILSRAFSSPWLGQIGRISYGLYIWHMLVFLAITPHLDRWGLDKAHHNLLRCMVLTVISMGVAGISWIVLEKPFIAWGKRLTAPTGWLEAARARVAKVLGQREAA
jgi:peptidoglycan/LPS O-acetylase OafA/YrhL